MPSCWPSAGLRRLGWENRITELFDPGIMCPAVGQGALAVETRDDGGAAFQICQTPGACRDARRGDCGTCGAGCAGRRMPGAHGRARLSSTAQHSSYSRSIVSPDGMQVVRKEMQGPVADAAALGHALAEQLLAEGGKANSRRRLRRTGMSKVYLVGAGPATPASSPGKAASCSPSPIPSSTTISPTSTCSISRPRIASAFTSARRNRCTLFRRKRFAPMMIERARRGLNVVRLKGGDPFIFGRGGEELEALADAGIPFEVVPGVTSPLGIAAYSGIPLTHRAHNKVLTFVTGHDVHGIDWSKVGQTETLVIFMGIFSIREIAAEIMRHGRSGDTPAVAVRWGTRPDQETVTGTLATIADRIEASRLEAARNRDHRRSGCAARENRLVRKAAAVRTQDRGDSRRGPGRRILRSFARAGRRCDRIAGDCARTARRSRAARSGHRKPGQLRLADLHQRQWRAILPGPAGSIAARFAVAQSAHLRHRTGDAPGRRGSASQSGSDAGRIRRRKPGESICLGRSRRQTHPTASRRRGSRCDSDRTGKVRRAGRRGGSLSKCCSAQRRGARARNFLEREKARLDHVHQFFHGQEPARNYRP